MKTDITTYGTQAPAVMQANLEAFRASLDVMERTREAYTNNAKQYIVWIASQGREGTRKADIIAYREDCLLRFKPATVSLKLSAVRALYDYLEDALGWPNVARSVHNVKRSREHKKDPLTTDQAKRVLGGIDRSTEKGLRDYAVLTLMIHTGLRCKEVAGADVRDLRSLGTRMVLYVQGKGRTEKDEYVVIEPGVLGAVYDYLNARGHVPEDAPLFASTSNRSLGERLDRKAVSTLAKTRFRAVGIDSDRITAHSLRHSAVTYAIMGGADLQQVQDMARHADPRTTMVYAHNLDRLNNPAEGAVTRALGF